MSGSQAIESCDGRDARTTQANQESLVALRAEMDERCARIRRLVQLMEVCGTHTVSIFRSGVRSMLPPNLKLISGPGCPVCVTAQRHLDAACALARIPGAIVTTYGDMLRVPGRDGSLQEQRAQGADVRIVTSARAAVRIAREHPTREVIFLGVGFETTAPATAAIVLEAERAGLRNLSVLACHKLVLPAMRALLAEEDVPIDGFLCPGHVSVVIGAKAYQPIVDDFRRPCVVAGFEPRQILLGITHLLRQIEEDQPALENVYKGVVSDFGNSAALALINRVFEPADVAWRELGVIPQSGLAFRDEYRRFDALERFDITLGDDRSPKGCRCGEVIQGKIEPAECRLFGRPCTPLQPLGPCMVSSEGACAAWYKYGGADLRRSTAEARP